MEPSSPQNWKRFARLKPDRKKLRRRARKIESATLKHAHTFIIRRWENIKHVRRFALSWLALVALLIGISGLQMVAYQGNLMRVQPTNGGTYAEAVTGPLETINPLFATTSAERSASRLVFASLLSYDESSHLRGEVAQSWRAEEGGKRYVVDLKQNVRWHDGQELTADDIIFTIERIKDPLTRANLSLYNSWTTVKVEKLSSHSVAFTLPVAYAPFLHALTFGIVPKHLLGDTKPESMREAEFNRNPVGAGPFTFNRLQIIDPSEDRVVLYLTANRSYIRGAPKLNRFQLHVYMDAEKIKKAFLTQEVNAATDLTSNDLAAIREEMPKAKVLDATIFDGVYALMRMDSPVLKDIKIREALRLGLDRRAVIDSLQGSAKPLEGPLLPEQVPGISTQRQPAFDAERAGQLLDEAGWKQADGGVRAKDGAELVISVVTPQIGDYPVVMEVIARQWRDLGVNVETQLVPPETIQQNVLLPRAYDVLVYEIALGADPDVYAYWHSSQADARRLNLSNYRSTNADEALRSAQSRLESNLRQPKYEAFVETWLRDIPAVALYRPTLHYVTTESAQTLPRSASMPDSEARYRNVELWTVERGTHYNTP